MYTRPYLCVRVYRVHVSLSICIVMCNTIICIVMYNDTHVNSKGLVLRLRT